jgi:hypothetical protein
VLKVCVRIMFGGGEGEAGGDNNRVSDGLV